MYLCYIDESGTPDIPGNTSHFILAGLSIPIWNWKDCDRDIGDIKKQFKLEGSEIHIAWILRPYIEQTKITGFESLDYKQRRFSVKSLRNSELLRLQKAGNPKRYKQAKKNFRKTDSYIHLCFQERKKLAIKIAQCIAGWGFARLFAECIDKIYFDPSKRHLTVSEQSFEQVVSRFEQYLQIIGSSGNAPCCGLLIHDNNQTVAKRLTDLMQLFHQNGTLWTRIDNIIETPLFVDSKLTSLVQIADVCAYALRRYLENKEDTLFNYIFERADRKDGIAVGVRHFANSTCTCRICSEHRKLVN